MKLWEVGRKLLIVRDIFANIFIAWKKFEKYLTVSCSLFVTHLRTFSSHEKVWEVFDRKLLIVRDIFANIFSIWKKFWEVFDRKLLIVRDTPENSKMNSMLQDYWHLLSISWRPQAHVCEQSHYMMKLWEVDRKLLIVRDIFAKILIVWKNMRSIWQKVAHCLWHQSCPLFLIRLLDENIISVWHLCEHFHYMMKLWEVDRKLLIVRDTFVKILIAWKILRSIWQKVAHCSWHLRKFSSYEKFWEVVNNRRLFPVLDSFGNISITWKHFQKCLAKSC